MKLCIHCGLLYAQTGSFCSEKCRNDFNHEQRYRLLCTECGQEIKTMFQDEPLDEDTLYRAIDGRISMQIDGGLTITGFAGYYGGYTDDIFGGRIFWHLCKECCKRVEKALPKVFKEIKEQQ